MARSVRLFGEMALLSYRPACAACLSEVAVWCFNEHPDWLTIEALSVLSRALRADQRKPLAPSRVYQ